MYFLLLEKMIEFQEFGNITGGKGFKVPFDKHPSFLKDLIIKNLAGLSG
jgi:hypothetical protein